MMVSFLRTFRRRENVFPIISSDVNAPLDNMRGVICYWWRKPNCDQYSMFIGQHWPIRRKQGLAPFTLTVFYKEVSIFDEKVIHIVLAGSRHTTTGSIQRLAWPLAQRLLAQLWTVPDFYIYINSIIPQYYMTIWLFRLFIDLHSLIFNFDYEILPSSAAIQGSTVNYKCMARRGPDYLLWLYMC